MTSRRGFLVSLFAASAVPSLSWADAGSPAFLAAAKETDGSFALYGLRADGSDAFVVPMAARGHAGAGHPTLPQAVAFARRPGDFALVLDCVTGATLATLVPPLGQYFNGHGTFSSDGSVLYTVENNAKTSAGIIGTWDSKSWKRTGQFATFGLGPHDLLRLPGSDDLVVANGGLKTDLATDDETRNIATMQPSLTYLSPNGDMLDMMVLGAALRRNSIRHLAVRPDGLVAFAMQWQGDTAATAPLVGLHRFGDAPMLVQAGAEEHALLKGYAGSIAFNPRGDRVAISSPKGGRLHVFDANATDAAASFQAALTRADICGLATRGNEMIATDGLGGVLGVTATGLSALSRANRAWDNHIVALPI